MYLGVWPSDRFHAWNLLTNEWAFNYVYKRLKFLDNKLVSRFLTLAFLALWHGYHSGFYIYFAMQFVIMAAEIDMRDFIAKTGLQRKLNNKISTLAVSGIGWILTSIVCSQSILTFALRQHFHLYYPILKSCEFLGITLPMTWFLVRHLLEISLFRRSAQIPN